MSPLAHGGKSFNSFPLTPRRASSSPRISSPSRPRLTSPASLARVLLRRSSSRGTGSGAGGPGNDAKTTGNDPASFLPRVSSPLSPPRVRHRSSSRGSTPAGRRLFSFASSSAADDEGQEDAQSDAQGDAQSPTPASPRLVTVQVVAAPAVGPGLLLRAGARLLRTVGALTRVALAVAAMAFLFAAVWSPDEHDAWREAWERDRAEERARSAALERVWCFLAFALPGGGGGGGGVGLGGRMLACG